MENQPEEEPAADINNHPQIALIDTFCELTGVHSKQEALFYLESHIFNLDAAVSTFLDDYNPPPIAAADNQPSPPVQSDENDALSPSNRSRSPSLLPAAQSYNLRWAGRPRTGGSSAGAGGGGIRTLSDLSRNPKEEEEDDSDTDPDFDPQEYYTGGEKRFVSPNYCYRMNLWYVLVGNVQFFAYGATFLIKCVFRILEMNFSRNMHS